MKVEYFLQNIPKPRTATWAMHPSTTVALDLVAGPAQGTLLVGKLVADLGRMAGGVLPKGLAGRPGACGGRKCSRVRALLAPPVLLPREVKCVPWGNGKSWKIQSCAWVLRWDSVGDQSLELSHFRVPELTSH